MSAIRFQTFRLLVALFVIFIAYPVTATPKREMRGVWIATVWGLDWPSVRGTDRATIERQKYELTELIDLCKRLNFTTICLQVRSMGDVIYPSELEPWSAFLTGRRGENPGWDPLEFAIQLCHERGLELYAWVNPFRWSTGTDYNTAPDRQWKQQGWLLSHGKYTVFNPGREDVRQHVVEICREIVNGYDVDGLVFDDYFYPNKIPEGASAPDYALHMADAPWMTFGDWRRACVHRTIADVHAMIADTRPGCRFGISPAGVAGKEETSAAKWGFEPCKVKAADWQYGEIYSDPLGLLYQGTIDFVSPQIYWSTTHPTAPFGQISEWWSWASNHYGTHLYTSMTLERLTHGDLRANIRDAWRQIAHRREAEVGASGGIMIYSARFIPQITSVVQSHFPSPALTPELRKTGASQPEPPTDLKYKDGMLTWHETGNSDGELMRYTIYAIPHGVSAAEALDPDGDGIAADYLLGVSYVPEYKLSTAYKGCRYAVCAYTSHSIESEPVWIDYR